VLIPNSIGNTGGLLAGLPRIAGAMLMGLGPTTVKTVKLGVNHENLSGLADLLESGAVRVIIDKTYPFDHTAAAVAHMLGHHARGQVAITVP
jgi:NADPH:quinone reductase-like Zn-dependent oxidoreductase